MTNPLPEIPLILLTALPDLLWEYKQPRCYESTRSDGITVLAAVSDELIPSRYESMEVLTSTLAGRRGSTIRGMAFRDLLARVDGTLGLLNEGEKKDK